MNSFPVYLVDHLNQNHKSYQPMQPNAINSIAGRRVNTLFMSGKTMDRTIFTNSHLNYNIVNGRSDAMMQGLMRLSAVLTMEVSHAGLMKMRTSAEIGA